MNTDYKIGVKVTAKIGGIEKAGVITKVFRGACNVKFKDEARCVRKKELKIIEKN